MCIQVVPNNMTQWAKPKDRCVILNVARSGTGLLKPGKQDLHGLHPRIALLEWFQDAFSESFSASVMPVVIETGTKRTKKTQENKFISVLRFR